MTPPAAALGSALRQFPFIAILRGIQPTEARDAAEILYNAGFRIIEVPLNSPAPFQSIALIAETLGDQVLIGAGTVTGKEQVRQVKDAGGTLIISPHCDREIIVATRQDNLISLPGIATPSEAFTAIHAGANALKLFPAEAIPAKIVKAIKTVLPADIALIPVGGITADNWQPYWAAGASGFGTGSSLYQKGLPMDTLQSNAGKFRAAWKAFQHNSSDLKKLL